MRRLVVEIQRRQSHDALGDQNLASKPIATKYPKSNTQAVESKVDNSLLISNNDACGHYALGDQNLASKPIATEYPKSNTQAVEGKVDKS